MDENKEEACMNWNFFVCLFACFKEMMRSLPTHTRTPITGAKSENVDNIKNYRVWVRMWVNGPPDTIGG